MRAKRHMAAMPDGTPIRLVPGIHSSPREGVCVVELASLIAREEFSDRPDCVCPVIGAFLRGWNDRAAHAERQRLGPYATRIVGSRGSDRVTRERRDICLEWAGADLRHGRVRRLLSEVGMRVRIAVFCGFAAAIRPNEGAGDYAARLAVARGDPERGFELLEALLAVHEDRRGEAVVAAGNGHAPANGNGQPAPGRDGLPATNGDGATSNGAPPAAAAPQDESSNGSRKGRRSRATATGSK